MDGRVTDYPPRGRLIRLKATYRNACRQRCSQPLQVVGVSREDNRLRHSCGNDYVGIDHIGRAGHSSQCADLVRLIGGKGHHFTGAKKPVEESLPV